MTLNPDPGFADEEVSLHPVVIAEPPALAVEFCGDFAEGFENFEQADVVAAIALHHGQRIVGGGGVDGKMFVGSGGGEKNRGEQDGRRDDKRYSRPLKNLLRTQNATTGAEARPDFGSFTRR